MALGNRLRVVFRRTVESVPSGKTEILDVATVSSAADDGTLVTVIKERPVMVKVPVTTALLMGCIGEDPAEERLVWKEVASASVKKHYKDKFDKRKANSFAMRRLLDGARDKGLITSEERVGLYNAQYQRHHRV